MSKQGLMPEQRYDPGHGFPMSRDHALDNVKCSRNNCVTCVHGQCVMPSRIKIGEDGKCKGFIRRKLTDSEE